MAKKSKPAAQTRPAQPAPKKPSRPPIALGKKNYIIMAVGLLTIVVGFILLAKGSITLAPLLLVVGYCVLIPVSLLIK
ncbi:MAG: DUF3098 domain-containing protein [candidate division WOR-3 bacterium]